jgi:hypothetical protein
MAVARTIICILFGLLTLATIGCAGYGTLQQPRLEISDSTRSMIVYPQGLLLSHYRIVLTREPQGTLNIRRLSVSHERGTHQDPAPDASLSGLHDALAPFLLPACQMPLLVDPY